VWFAIAIEKKKQTLGVPMDARFNRHIGRLSGGPHEKSR
jgi:hypothetical protein